MLRFLTVPLAFALFGITLPTPVAAQGGVILPIVPTISIKATVAETREPFCDPAICDAAPPPPAVFRVTRTGGDLTAGVSVYIAFEGSASNGVDYAKLPDVVRFPAGAESVDLYVEGLFDQLAEGDEIVVAKLLPDPSMGPIGFYRLDPLQNAARVLIHDREMSIEPMVSIVASSEIAEETSYPYRRLAFRGVFNIARSGPTNHAVSVFVHYSGSAQPGVDFPALPWLVTIPAGADIVELVVEPTVDNVSEPIEFLDAKLDQCPPLTNPPMGIPCYAANIDLARSTARIFLRDDGITTASLELTSPRDGSEYRAGQPIRLAATAIDLEGAITYVEFYDGPTKVGESSIFFIRQPDPGTPIHHEIEWTGAAIGSHELTARAVNAAGSKVSSPPVRIRVSDGLPVVSIEATVPETMEPSPTTRIRPGVFTFRRTGDTTRALRVWVSYGGTASPERDYSELLGIVEFPAGSSSVDLQVVPLDDGLAETDESVVAELVPSPLAVRPDYEIDPINRRAVVVIHDNEMAVPFVSVRATQPITSEPCPVCLVVPGVFTITRTGGTDAPLGVWYRLSGTAVNGLDYDRLSGYATIPAGQPSVDIRVLGVMDNLAEGDETVVMTLVVPEVVILIYPPPPPPYRVDVANSSATVAIRNFPYTPALPVVTVIATDPFAREGASGGAGRNTAEFTVIRSGETNLPLSVYFELSGTAVAGSDFRIPTSPLVIPAGQRRARLVLEPMDDSQSEPIESAVITLIPDATLPGNYSVGSPRRAAAIIVDNDRLRPPCLRLPNGLFNLCLPAGTNSCFRIEVTRDFKEWSSLCIIPANEERAHYVDPDASGAPQRFYRAVPVACE